SRQTTRTSGRTDRQGGRIPPADGASACIKCPPARRSSYSFLSTTRIHPRKNRKRSELRSNFSYAEATRNKKPLNMKYAGYWPRYWNELIWKPVAEAHFFTAADVFVLYAVGHTSMGARPCTFDTIQG